MKWKINWNIIDKMNIMNMLRTNAALFGEILSQCGHFCGFDVWIFCMCAYNENWLNDALHILHLTRICSICFDWICFSSVINAMNACPQCSQIYLCSESSVLSSTPSLWIRLKFFFLTKRNVIVKFYAIRSSYRNFNSNYLKCILSIFSWTKLKLQ